jgi:CheY-like chemotaxis protein
MSGQPKPFDDPNGLLETRILNGIQPNPIAPPRETGPLDADLGAPWVVDLRIHDTPLTVRMDVRGRLVLGRSDVGAKIFPDLDLTPYGGQDKGVSRRHAAILAELDRLAIVDLGSTNGTSVNGQRLKPNCPYRLRHGDDIQVGEVRIEVRLSVMPMHYGVAQEQPWVRSSSHSQKGSGQHILVVEGNESVSDTLRTILTRLGYQVQVAQEMADAFYLVTRRMPDAIVINLDLSNINGLELCRYIQRLAHKEYVPLIIISEDTARHHIDEIMNAGGDVFLSKPFGLNELTRAVSAVTQNNSHTLVGRG